MKIIYRAFDGVEFDSEEECLKYEKEAHDFEIVYDIDTTRFSEKYLEALTNYLKVFILNDIYSGKLDRPTKTNEFSQYSPVYDKLYHIERLEYILGDIYYEDAIKCLLRVCVRYNGKQDIRELPVDFTSVDFDMTLRSEDVKEEE